MPSKKLIIEQTNGETYDITVYDTKEECPEPNMYVTFAAENGVSEEGWIKLGEETDYGATQATFKDDSDGKVYHILKAIYYKAEIIQSDNQTIHVWTPQKDGGTDHTETFMVEAGTGWEAEVVPNSGYNAGELTAQKKKNEDEYPVLTDFTLYLYEGKPNSIKFTTPENAISPMNIGVYTSLTSSPEEVSTSPANYEIVPNTKYDVWIEDGSSNQRIASNPYILHMNDDSITGYCSSGNPIRFEFHIDTEKNGLTDEEFQALIDGGYGPAPVNGGNVNLAYYAII